MKIGELKKKYFLWLILVVYVAALFFHSQLVSQRRADTEVGIPKYAFGDGIYYQMLTENIIKNHRFYIYDSINEIKNTLKASGFSRGKDGKININFYPLFSIVLIPAYFIGGVFGAYLFNALMGVLTCYIIYKTCKRFVGEDTAVDTTIVFAFGSIIFTYSQVIYAEILTALLTAASFYFIVKYESDKRGRHLFYSGLSGGMLMLAKPTLLIMPAALVLYHFVRNRFSGLLYLVAPIALASCLFFAYNMTTTGSMLKTTYSSEIIVYENYKTTIDHTEPNFWQNNPVKTVPIILFLLILTQPILIASVVGIMKNWGLKEVKYLTMMSLALLLAYSARYNPVGFWCWSTRLLMPVIPLLSVPFAIAYDKGQVSKNLIAILAIISIALTLFSLAPVSWHLFTQFPVSQWVTYEPV